MSYVHNVIPLNQQKPNACWYTCYIMLYDYYKSLGRGQNLVNPRTHSETQTLFNQDNGIMGSQAEHLAPRLGFTLAYISHSRDGMDSFLNRYPIIYGGLWVGGTGGHDVVFVGIQENTLIINDPLQGRRHVDFNNFRGSQLAQMESDYPLIYVNEYVPRIELPSRGNACY